MERKDVMSKNVAIYKAQAAALEKGAAPGCKVRVGWRWGALEGREMRRAQSQAGWKAGGKAGVRARRNGRQGAAPGAFGRSG